MRTVCGRADATRRDANSGGSVLTPNAEVRGAPRRRYVVETARLCPAIPGRSLSTVSVGDTAAVLFSEACS